jgi:hypothetical protein
MNVGIGVGVGRTNDGLGVGPVAAGDGVGDVAADPPVAAGPTVGGRQPATTAARERTRVGPARRAVIG